MAVLLQGNRERAVPVQNRAVGLGLADNNATHKAKRTERGQNQRTTRREEMNMKKLFLILAAAVVLSPSAWAYSHYSS